MKSALVPSFCAVHCTSVLLPSRTNIVVSCVPGAIVRVNGPSAKFRSIVVSPRLTMKIEYHVPAQWTRPINVGFAIWRSDNVLIAAASSGHDGVVVPQTAGGRHRALIQVPRLDLHDGEFTVIGYIYDEMGLHIYDHRMNDHPLVVKPEEGRVGLMTMNHEWEFEDLA